LLIKVVIIQSTVLGKNHPNQLLSQQALAEAYQSNGEAAKAIPLLKKVVAIQSQILPKDHPIQLSLQQALANAYKSNGEVSKAIPLLKKVIAILLSQRPSHPALVTAGTCRRLRIQWGGRESYNVA